MKTQRIILAALVTAASFPGPCRSQTAQSADYRLASAAAVNGGGGSSASTGYTLHPASVEATAAGISTSSDYTASAGWVTQVAAGCPAFDAWRAAKLPGHPQNAALDDPDSDGVVNLIEFALDTNPLSGASASPFTVAADGPNIRITFQRVPACLTYSIEISSDPAANDWQPASAPVSVSTTLLPGGMESVQVTLPQSLGPRQFLRLRATIP